MNSPPYVYHSAPPPPLNFPDYNPTTGFGQTTSVDANVEEYKKVGRKAEYKRVVEKYDSMSMRWGTKEQSEEEDKPDEKIDELDECCFVFRKKITPQGPGLPPYIDTFLDLKSWYLRKAGQEVVGVGAGISWWAKSLELDCHKILPYFQEIQAFHDNVKSQPEKNEDDNLMISHLELFLGFLSQEFKDLLSELGDMFQTHEITWERVWALWKPGGLFLMSCPVTEEPFIVRLQSALPASKDIWQLTYEYLDSTKSSFGLKTEIHNIDRFIGRVPTSTLGMYPLEHFPDHVKLKERLVVRGKAWQKLNGIHHLFYDGNGYLKDNYERVKKTRVKGRVIIDKDSYQNMQSDYRLNPFFNAMGHAPPSTLIGKITAQIRSPSDSDLLMAPPYVHGFSLVDKRWLMFEVNHLAPIKWDVTSFQNLSIPKGRKALLRSLVEVHHRQSGFDDIVAGKGKGLVINLFGPPGTGKTLTAEATSEHVRKPLYVVTAGELGNESSTMGVQLSHIFDVSAKWGAIVLLDEADIFLERRSTHEIHRNAMVSVFLRELEYFEGILFLTTNRIETFDPAFQSRIHISLRYAPLRYMARRDVWLAILRRAGLHEDSLTRVELGRLVSTPKNGRQIRNIVRTAEAVAASRNEPLDYQHLSQVKDITDRFESGERTLMPSMMTMAQIAVCCTAVGAIMFQRYISLLQR